jgi:hypothetical protein
MKAFNRSRERIHEGTGLVFISDVELAEQGIVDATRIGHQLEYNGVVHSIRGISAHGILIWKLGDKGPL